MVALTRFWSDDNDMKPKEARMRMTQKTRLRAPMMRVPVFREMHEQQFGSFGRETIFVNKYLKLNENEINPGTKFLEGTH